MKHSRLLPATLAAVALTIGVAACGDDDSSSDTASTSATTAASGGTASSGTASSGTTASAPAGAATITITGFSFGDPISVAAGTKVTVVNDADVTHTLTADDGSFDTGDLKPGDSAVITFDTAGTFTFHCNIHPSMQGSITVTG